MTIRKKRRRRTKWDDLDELPISKDLASQRAKESSRKDAEWARKHHSLEYVFWAHMQGCCVTGTRQAEFAHLGNEGLGRKSHYKRAVPLNYLLHREDRYALDKIGQEAFEERNNIDLNAVARNCWAGFNTNAARNYIEAAKQSGHFEQWRRSGRVP